jgi:nicotinate-nucleotide--dimethylbenzimidazole phosphoribosyltransferase
VKLNWINQAVARLDADAQQAATDRQAQLTKPPGALGELEVLAIRFAAMQATPSPLIDRVQICVFAADHGVATEAVSAFPQAVTAEMVKNFSHGGAAISVLAKEQGAQLQVVNLGTVIDPGPLDGVLSLKIAAGTANFTQTAAMTDEQLEQALNAGREAVKDGQVFIGGEMGIGNTTSATALASVLLKKPSAQLAGPGTGLNQAGVARKISIIERALALHADAIVTPLDALRCLGGLEIAALVGAYIHCAQQGITVLVDGFISSVAALLATRIQPEILPWLVFTHRSAEPGHQAVLTAMEATPLLDLGMRLGEGSGAAVALPLIRQACALHNGMATFAEAQVSE